MAEPAVTVTDLVKVYHEKSRHPVRALSGLTIRVERGEIFGLLGRNGAGKTTLLRILTTLIPPTSGCVTVLGRDVMHDPLGVRKNICVVLQENAVELYLSVRDNLTTYARFHSIPPAQVRRRADRAIEQFGLNEYTNQKVIDLSTGLKRRVQVAKVFMVDTPLVFLDEPTTGMDPITKRATIDAIRDQARIGRTILFTTHILREAEELCDTIAIIDKGKCLACGSLHQIKSLAHPALDVTITFDPLTEAILTELRTLPLLKLSHENNTVELCVRGGEIETFELLARLARTRHVVQVEVNSASLEDAFLELLDHQTAEGRHSDGKGLET